MKGIEKTPQTWVLFSRKVLHFFLESPQGYFGVMPIHLIKNEKGEELGYPYERNYTYTYDDAGYPIGTLIIYGGGNLDYNFEFVWEKL